jgi:hypothetical protein
MKLITLANKSSSSIYKVFDILHPLIKRSHVDSIGYTSGAKVFLRENSFAGIYK